MSRCPHCGREIDLIEIAEEENLRAIIELRDAFHPHSHLVWAYAELFGVTPFKSKARKLRAILEEMKRLFESESFTYNKTTYRISKAGIAEALSVVVKRHFSDRLENHNYLKKVMISIAEREAREGSRLAEAELRRKEERLLAGNRYPENGERVILPREDEPPGELTEEQRRVNLQRLAGLLKNIGG
ncbi:MAG TPA: hypothetical protein PK659_09790 [Methanothrix sp.]|nr:hypothetical protein [Methanothrix sp.]HOL44532.1 hypothetical protein [Methanothrix sp.]